ncbi:hypothetical protein VNO77_20211 [Canavalia gladiata]|uniref:Uncharacterized protein n=1 Tax=Canavalia gladiata TaxID=3824 RepID=A0AAN9LP17_CANGL
MRALCIGMALNLQPTYDFASLLLDMSMLWDLGAITIWLFRAGLSETVLRKQSLHCMHTTSCPLMAGVYGRLTCGFIGPSECKLFSIIGVMFMICLRGRATAWVDNSRRYHIIESEELKELFRMTEGVSRKVRLAVEVGTGASNDPHAPLSQRSYSSPLFLTEGEQYG